MNKPINASPVPQLEAAHLDQIAEGDRRLWGMQQIARALSVSESTAARWRDDAASGVPITRIGGRWTAMRGALRAWLKVR